MQYIYLFLLLGIHVEPSSLFSKLSFQSTMIDRDTSTRKDDVKKPLLADGAIQLGLVANNYHLYYTRR